MRATINQSTVVYRLHNPQVLLNFIIVVFIFVEFSREFILFNKTHCSNCSFSPRCHHGSVVVLCFEDVYDLLE